MKHLILVGATVVGEYDLPDHVEPYHRPARQREGWTKIRGGKLKGGIWRHASGGIVQHCGHPTAIYPYQAWARDGRELRADNGGTFRYLDDAQLAVEHADHGAER